MQQRLSRFVAALHVMAKSIAEIEVEGVSVSVSVCGAQERGGAAAE